MMKYKELAKLYHMDSSAGRDSENIRLAHERQSAESSFRLGYSISNGELFIAVPKELSILNEKVLRTERKVSLNLRAMPGIAREAILRSLVLDEVVSSNEIEGVRSTRRQIKDALESKSGASMAKRFRELATLYIDIIDGVAVAPSTPMDIREIYDRIMEGELSRTERLDGELFRAGGVDVVDEKGRVLHRGIEPEEKIVEALEAMLRTVGTDDLPALYGAVASHFLFEYAHPFYDGNGRTGRYLLALYLSVPLSMATSLSLSRAIAENKRKYYKAFATAQDPLNHGELTHFVYEILDLVNNAQTDILRRLEKANESYVKLIDSMDIIENDLGLKEKEMQALFVLMQYQVFGLFGDAPLSVIADNIGLKEQRARQYMSLLMEKGAVAKVRGRNPISFGLTSSFKERYGIRSEWGE